MTHQKILNLNIINVPESTRASRKQRIVAECNNVRQALQDLLEEYERNVSHSLKIVNISISESYHL